MFDCKSGIQTPFYWLFLKKYDRTVAPMQKDIFYKELGQRLKACRKMRGIPLKRVAKNLERSIATISKYENGEIIISLDVLLDYCRCLQIELATILPPSQNCKDKEQERYTHLFIDQLWLYWYKKTTDSIHISSIQCDNNAMRAELYFDVKDVKNRQDCLYLYQGEVVYSDHSISFFVQNTIAPYDTITLNLPTMYKESEYHYRIGLSTGITFNYQNVGVKILASSELISDRAFLLEKLTVSQEEIRTLKKRNYFYICEYNNTPEKNR